MSRTRALILVFIGGLLLEIVGILGLAMVGVDGVALSLGAIIPLVLTADVVSRVVMHYGSSSRPHR
jgi:hypothetical protein